MKTKKDFGDFLQKVPIIVCKIMEFLANLALVLIFLIGFFNLASVLVVHPSEIFDVDFMYKTFRDILFSIGFLLIFKFFVRCGRKLFEAGF